MKSNFSNSELRIIHEKVGSHGIVRINKAGNIDIRFNNTKNDEWFVLYFTRNKKYLWRRHAYTYYGKCEYPLNMRRFKVEKIKDWEGNYYNYRPYTIENSEFNTFNEAVDYFFRNYLGNFPYTKQGKKRM